MKQGETFKKQAKTKFRENLGNIIKAYRKENGLSQEDYAEKSGISESYVAKVEQDRIKPGSIPLYRIEQIANSMDMSLDDFLLEWVGGTIEERRFRQTATLIHYLLLMPLLSPIKLLELSQRLLIRPEEREEIQNELYEHMKEVEANEEYPYIRDAIAKYELHHDDQIPPEHIQKYLSMVEQQKDIYEDIFYLTHHVRSTVNKTEGREEAPQRLFIPLL